MNRDHQGPKGAENLQADRFFDSLEDRIIKRLHSEAESDESRAALINNTGLHDQKLISELITLGITVEGLMALRMFPLALVAWASGGVSDAEHDTVMKEAASGGITPDSVPALILDSWLRRRPPGLGFDAWKRYTHEMFATMSKASVERLIHVTEKQMYAVAKASGGHFGFGKVSHAEREQIERLVRVMRSQIDN